MSDRTGQLLGMLAGLTILSGLIHLVIWLTGVP